MKFLKYFGSFLLRTVVTIFVVIIYFQLLAYFVPRLNLDYTVIEIILMVVAIILAIITTEFIFNKSKKPYTR